ncbi:glycosyltransferase family 87 protein [Rhizobium sp. LEGMi198b]
MQSRVKLDFILAGIVVIIGMVRGLHFITSLWTLTPDGISATADRLPYWDFTNLWAGSLMALKGHVAYLFDVAAYRQELRMLLSPLLPDHEWSYPPSILLIGIPFAALPIFPAYILWTLLTLLLLFLAAKLLELNLWARMLIIISPAAMINMILGQNGALTTALLLFGLSLAPRRPIIAGIFFGLLTIKPQLGVLVPFCLLAGGNYRAIFSACVTTLVLIGTTGLLFGFDVWSLFLTETRPLMTEILEAPFPQGYQVNATTFFMLARSLGFGLSASYMVQALFSLVAIVAVLWLWRGKTVVDHPARVCLTAVLTLVAMPYGYSYDTIPMNVAVVYLFFTRRSALLLLLIVWLYPLFNQQMVRHVASLGVLVPTALATWMLVLAWRNQLRLNAEAAKTNEPVTSKAFSTPPVRSDDSCLSAG